MKKSQVYFAIPLVVLVIFIAFYWNFSKAYNRHQAERAAAVQKARDQALQEQNRIRLKAVQDTLAAQEKRKAEKVAKDQAEQKKRADRQTAYQVRDQAQIGISKWRERHDRLAKEVTNLKEQIAKIQADKQTQVEQKTFLDKLAKQTVANTASLRAVLEKVAHADEAWAAAAAAAARAAAEKK